MGQRGPAPTPTEVLRLRGSWRAERNPAEPQPMQGRPRCPKSLPAAARRIWRRLVLTLEQMKLLSKADGGQLERYARYFVRWRECEEFVTKNGLTYALKSDDPSCFVGKLPDGPAVVGFVEYPQVRESHRLDKALKQIEASFGLTPSARTRIQVGAGGEVAKPAGVMSRNREMA